MTSDVFSLILIGHVVKPDSLNVK